MQTVIYSSLKKLDCQCDADIIICIDADLTLTGRSFIEATLVTTTTTVDHCLRTIYNYTIQYDETLLVDPTSILYSSDIHGIICEGCLTAYIEAMGIPSIDDIEHLLSPVINGFCPVTNEAEFILAIADADCHNIIIGGSFLLTDDRTVPADKSVYSMTGCIITTGGYILTFNGPFTSPAQQAFIADPDEVLFAGNSCFEIHPEWWGAVADGLTDSTNAIQCALQAGVAVSSVPVRFVKGVYLASNLKITKLAILVGSGPGSSYIRHIAGAVPPNLIDIEYTGGGGVGSKPIWVKFYDIALDSSIVNDPGYAIASENDYEIPGLYIERFQITGFTRGISIPLGIQVHIGHGTIVSHGAVAVGTVGIIIGEDGLFAGNYGDVVELDGVWVGSAERGVSLHGYAFQATNINVADVVTAISVNIGHICLIGCKLQAATYLYYLPSTGTASAYDCTHYDAVGTELLEPGTMMFGTLDNLSSFIGNTWRGGGGFEFPTIVDSTHDIKIGAVGSSVRLWQYDHGLWVHASSTTYAALHLNANDLAAAYLARLKFYRNSTLMGSLGLTDDDEPALLNTASNAAALAWNNDLDVGAGIGTLATNATHGFLRIPKCAGTPTGIPATVSVFMAAHVPMVYDSTNNKLYVYNAGAWNAV